MTYRKIGRLTACIAAAVMLATVCGCTGTTANPAERAASDGANTSQDGASQPEPTEPSDEFGTVTQGTDT